MCCRGCAPPWHSHTVHPDGRSSPLRARGTWRWWLHPCYQQHQTPSTGSQKDGGWKGPLGVSWSKSGYLHLWKYYLCYFILSKLCEVCWDPNIWLCLLDSWKKMGHEIYSSLFFTFFQSAAMSILKWWSGTASYSAKFCWRWGSSGGKVVTQASWQQSCAWGGDRECERDWPALCDGIFHPPHRQHWGLSQTVQPHLRHWFKNTEHQPNTRQKGITYRNSNSRMTRPREKMSWPWGKGPAVSEAQHCQAWRAPTSSPLSHRPQLNQAGKGPGSISGSWWDVTDVVWEKNQYLGKPLSQGWLWDTGKWEEFAPNNYF